MNEQGNTYKEEINLNALLLYCIKRWRWIVGVMLVIAILMGGYKYYSTRKGNQLALQQWNATGIETEEDISDTDVLQFYQSAIGESAEALRLQEDYMDNSVIMQLDANHLQKVVLCYAVKTNDMDSNINMQNTLIDAYRTYVTDGRLAQLLYSKDKNIDTSDMRYLVTSPKLSADSTLNTDVLTIDIQQPEMDSGVFQIQIISPNKDDCEQYLKTAMKELQLYSENLQDQIGSHELVLLGSAEMEGQEQTIRDYQLEVLNNYKAAVSDLGTLKSAEMTYATNAEAGDDTSDELLGPVLANPIKNGMKYGILGLAMGCFLTVFFLIAKYLMSDRLRTTENFEEKFGIRLLGRVAAPVSRKRIFGYLDCWLRRLEEGAYANLPYEEQIRIVSSNVKAAISVKAGNPRIMFAGTIAAKDANMVCSAVAKGIDDVVFSNYRQLIFDASALEELKDYDGILFVEKKDISSPHLISQERKMVASRGVDILGVIIM